MAGGHNGGGKKFPVELDCLCFKTNRKTAFLTLPTISLLHYVRHLDTTPRAAYREPEVIRPSRTD